MTEERDSMLYAAIVSVVEELDVLAYRWNQEDVMGCLVVEGVVGIQAVLHH